MNAFRALGRGIVPEAESAWLFKIAENVCLSRRRSSWRRGRIESPSDFEIIEEIIPGPSRQNDELIGIEDALASMPEQQRRAILLREWQGLSYREIAEELDVTQSAVETLIFRARRSLAAGLEQPDCGQEAEAQELPPRPARVRHRHGCRRAQDAARRERGRQGNGCRRRGHSSSRYRLRRREDRVEAARPRGRSGEDAGQQADACRCDAPRESPHPRARFDLLQVPRRSVRSSRPPPSTQAPGPKPAATAVVKHSAPLHHIPAADTPLQAVPAEQTPAAVRSRAVRLRLQLPRHSRRRSSRAQTRARTTAASGTLEPVTQLDASAVVPTATPAPPASPSKAEPVAVGHAVTIVPTPVPAVITNPAPAPVVAAAPTAPTPVATTPARRRPSRCPAPATN